MRLATFSSRTAKEILRDPLNLAFGVGFPLILIALLSAMQANIPVPLFTLSALIPGVSVFGLSFMTLFSATLVAKDRESAFLQRLYTTPLRAHEFVLGYVLPLLPIALLQTLMCYAAGLCLGLKPTVRILYALVGNIPVGLLFISLGLLCGSVLGSKQVGGICGALLTNLSAWLSGTWFDLKLVGGAFVTIANLLPFVHAVEMERALLKGNLSGIFPHIWWVLAYAVVITVLAILLFLRQMKKQ